MWIDTQVGSESHALVWFGSLLWGISAGFPVANHFDLPSSLVHVDMSQVLPRVWAHLLVKIDSSEEAYG